MQVIRVESEAMFRIVEKAGVEQYSISLIVWDSILFDNRSQETAALYGTK